MYFKNTPRINFLSLVFLELKIFIYLLISNKNIKIIELKPINKLFDRVFEHINEHRAQA